VQGANSSRWTLSLICLPIIHGRSGISYELGPNG
jgi:hypothetical protein